MKSTITLQLANISHIPHRSKKKKHKTQQRKDLCSPSNSNNALYMYRHWSQEHPVGSHIVRKSQPEIHLQAPQTRLGSKAHFHFLSNQHMLTLEALVPMHIFLFCFSAVWSFVIICRSFFCHPSYRATISVLLFQRCYTIFVSLFNFQSRQLFCYLCVCFCLSCRRNTVTCKCFCLSSVSKMFWGYMLKFQNSGHVSVSSVVGMLSSEFIFSSARRSAF